MKGQDLHGYTIEADSHKAVVDDFDVEQQGWLWLWLWGLWRWFW